MTHSVTVVCIKPEDGMTIDEQLSKALAPFDENSEEVDEDVKNEDGQVISGARWDWWLVGGRWTGYFKLKPEFSGDARVFKGRPGTMTQAVTDPAVVDGAPKGMIDLEGMRNDHGLTAGEKWDTFQRIAGPYRYTTVPWSKFLARAEDPNDPMDHETARKEYHAQPGMVVVREHREELDVGWTEDAFEKYSVPRAKMVADARRDAVAGWAVLTVEGEYREKGWMGWWAMNDATEESRQQFGDWANAYFDSLTDDTYLIAVDVHI